MSSVSSRLLVIDASVVRAAGETIHPVSSACREYLLAIRRICHRVGMTEKIREEWDRHMSRFTRKWRRSMAARRKPDVRLTPANIHLNISEFSAHAQATIEKDRHLLEAASAADNVIVTLDESFKKALAETPSGTSLLNSVRWFNPVKDGVKGLESL